MTFSKSLSSVLCTLTVCIVVAAATNLDVELLRQNHNGPTSDGTNFAVAFMDNTDSNSMTILYILNNNPNQTAVVEVSLPNDSDYSDYPKTASIGPNSREVFTFPSTGSDDIRVIADGNINRNKGIQVNSTNNVPVTVIGSNSATKSTDAFLVLPCQTATTNDYHYFIFSSDPGGAHASQFVVVACEDNTNLDIVYKDGRRVSETITSAFQLHGVSDSADFTGTIVSTKKPVAVFSGHQCGRIPGDQSACDHLVEQIPMHAVWGNTFFTAPFGYRGAGEIYRIGTILPDNKVTITCTERSATGPTTYSTSTRNLSAAGDHHQLETTRSPKGTPLTNYRRNFCCIETSKPAIMMQYMPGHNLDETSVNGVGSDLGDPSISIIPPVEQYRSSLIGTTIMSSEVFTNMATWTIPSQFFDPSNANEVLLNNGVLNPGNFKDFQGGSGEYIPIRCSNNEVCGYGAFSPLPSTISGAYRLNFNASKDPYAGINFNLYGYVAEMSYAYTPGFEMEPIGLARITVYSLTVSENVGSVTIPFNRTGGDLSTNSRIQVQTRSVQGQAVEGTDYTAVGRTRIRWRPGTVDPISTDPEFTVPILNDEIAEPNKYFEVFFTVDVNGYPFPGVARVTIIDDDGVTTPNVQFDPTSYTVTEGQATTLTLRLSSASASVVMVTVASSDGTATVGVDYASIGQTVAFPPNTLTTNFAVMTINDNINEVNENFEVTITGASAATVGTDDKATVTILDNDDLTVQFVPDTYTVEEGEQAQFTVQLNRAASRPVSVTFNTADGTATSDDYTSVTSRTVTFPTGSTQQTVAVQTTTDSTVDNGETFTATLSSPTNGLQLGSAVTGTATILDPLVVSFNPTTDSVTEGVNSAATLTVILSRASTESITVNFATEPGTASAPSDYTVTTTTVTFSPGSTRQQVSVPIINDDVNELTEAFTAELSSPSGAELGASTATITIGDNDDLRVQFDPDSYTVAEGNQAQFRVMLNGEADRPVSVTFNTVAGTATAPDDYTSVTSRTVTFPAGSTQQTVAVQTSTDSVVDNGETFTATLSNPTNGLQLGSARMGTATILDPVVVSFSPTTDNVTEGVNSAATLTVMLSRSSTESITVDFTTVPGTASAPSDYTVTTTTVTFSPGSTSQQVSVPIINDNVNELTEAFTAELSSPSGAQLGASTATITIGDNDDLEFRIIPATLSIPEGQTSDLTVQLNVAADRAVSVTVASGGGTATAGTDYTPISSDVTFQPGDTEQTISVVTSQDEIDEPDETFEVSLSNPIGGGTLGTPSSSTVTIDDDDDPISVQFVPATYNVGEGGSAGLMVVLSRNPAVEVQVTVTTVPGSATGADYTAVTRTLTFPAGGSRNMTVSVPILTDNINDPGESFIARLSSPSGAALGSATEATVNIIDTNPVNVQFMSPVTYSVSEGSSVNVIAILNVASTQDLTVDFDTMPGSATSDDYTAVRRTLTFSAGTTSVSVPITTLGDNIGEPDEMFSVLLRNAGRGLSVGAQDTATITILANDTPDVRFDPNVYSVNEGEQGMLMLFLSNPSSSEITVLLMTADESAIAPSDYTAVSTTVTFAAGVTSAIVPVEVLEDSINERPENFTATLSNPSGATLGTPSQATITIYEDDDLTVNFNPVTYMIVEGGNAVLNAILNSPANREVTVQVRTVAGTATDADYNGGVRTLTFQAGSTSATTSISTVDDDIQEGVERFTAELFNPQNGLSVGLSSTATIDITDNDVVMVMFERITYTVDEGDTIFATVLLSLASTETVSVDVASSADTATDSVDYTTVSQTLTFLPGDTSASFPVMALADQIDELQEQFPLSLSNPSSNAMLGAASTATVFINDTNTLLVDFVPAAYSVKEGDAVNLTAMLNIPADRDVSVIFSTVPGTASEATDYTPVMMTLTFLRSQTTATITVMTTDDDIQEGTERFTATLTSPTNGLEVGSDRTATIDIGDDDVVNVQFEPTTYSVSEDGGVAGLTVILTKPSVDQVLVDIAISDGTARAPSDYTTVSTTLTFLPGDTSQVVPVSITNDDTNEEQEMFTATLSNPLGASLGPDTTATISIDDDDPLTIQFDPTEYTGDEGKNVSVTAVLNRPADRVITVTLMTKDDSATSPADYTTTSVVLTFLVGQQTASTSIPIADDGINERQESFTATLSSPSGGATLGPDSSATVTIPSTETLTVNFDPDTYTVDEGDSEVLILRLNSPADRSVSVDVTLNPDTATAGTDYVDQTYTVTFPAGETTQVITVMTLEDSLSEGIEDFSATLSNPVGDGLSIGDMGTATVTIDDDDVLSINFDPTAYTVDEGERASIIVVLSNPSTSTVTVDVETVVGSANASDFDVVNELVSFAPGETSRIVNVTTLEDNIDEVNEIFSVVLKNEKNAALGPRSRAEVTILDDDVVALEFDRSTYTVTEGDNAVITVVADKVPAMDVSVTLETSNGDATSPDDYTAITNQVVTIPSGQRSVTVMVPTIDDTIAEQTEYFTVRLSNPSQDAIVGPMDSAAVLIMDNDRSTVNLEKEEYSVMEGDGVVMVCITLSNRVDEDILVAGETMSLVPPQAQDGADYTSSMLLFNVSAGSTRACDDVDIMDDDIVENMEKFEVILSPIVSPLIMLGDTTKANVTIFDDDSTTANIERPTYQVRENETSLEVCATLSNPSSEDVDVTASTKPTSPPQAQAGEDFVSETITFVFKAGEIRACSRVSIVDNKIRERPEEFLIEIDPPTTPGGPAPGPGATSTVTIEDDDVVNVSWETPEIVTPETSGTVMVCFTTDKGSSTAYTVTVTSEGATSNPAIFGEDYSTSSRDIVVSISAGPARKYCVEVMIIDDGIAMEGNETFVLRFQDLPSGVTPGPIPESSVEIIDTDVVAVDFQTPDMTVSEGAGDAVVCVIRNATTEESMTVTVVTNFGSADASDIEPVTKDVVFAPNQTVSCIDVPIKNDQNPEARESFTLSFVPQPGLVTPAPGNVAMVTIIDDDVPTTTACVIQDALRVSPFNATPSYQFRGSCELTAVTSCSGVPDFSVRVDYLTETLDIGAVGVLKDGLVWTVREDRTIESSSSEVPVVSGNTTRYESSAITITRGSEDISISVGDGIGVTVVRSFAVEGSVMITGGSLDTCGICGTQQGQLRSLDGTVTPIDASMEAKQAFVSGYLVPARDQQLRPVRAECAVVRNDTITSDPLYTVPFGIWNLNLCYEIHGKPNTIFNLISDTCVNVNAQYTAVNTSNIIDSIAIRAQGDSKTCRDIRVDLEGCAAFASQLGGGGSLVQLTGMLEEDGISVRPYSNRVRIAVPNCNNLRLVMWAICEPTTPGIPSHIRFHVSRGVNLSPTSHGLLGQFWNIPIIATPLSQDTYNVTIQPMNGAPTRYIQGDYYFRTWDNRKEPCIYMGNAQGGRSGENRALDDSVIQGTYKNYEMEDMFDTAYVFDEWDGEC